MLTCFLVSFWLCVDSVEGEGRLPGDGEFGDGERVHLVVALRLVFALGEFLEALADVKGHVNEGAVAVTLSKSFQIKFS